MPYRLAIVETHPIQYKVPWFRLLNEHPDVDVTVFYCMIPDAHQQGDGFGVSFEWDVPLLEGYTHRVLENRAAHPSVTSFFGCDTPSIKRALGDHWDAVIVNGWVTKSCIQTLLACRFRGIPCIVRGESNAIRRRAWWKRVLHRLLLKQYAGVLYIGKSNRDFYLQNGVPCDRLFFCPYCVDNDRFARAADNVRERRQELRKVWGIAAGSFCFVFCGKLEPKKRPADILRALRELRETDARACRDLHVLVVGDGELRPWCEGFVAEYGLPVTFAGFMNQTRLPEAYAVSDGVLLPSDSGETWGLVVNEAMSCGLPAIVSDEVGCASDLVTPGETGAVYPCGDTVALARAMASAAQDRSHWAAMGAASRERVAAYSLDHAVSGVLDALSAVVPRQEKR